MIRKKAGHTVKRTILAAVLAFVCMTMPAVLSSCGTDDIDISGYSDAVIELIGLSDEPVAVTISDLKAMECRSVKTESTSDKIGKVRATGPELDTVLEKYGASKADFSKIIINGSDKYDVKLLNDYITEHDIYLAFGIDGKPLDEESVPCRIIIPKSDSAYWVRMVTSIEFVK